MAEPKVRFKRDDGSEFPVWENHSIGYYLEIRDEKQTPSELAPLMAFIAYQGVADKGERYDRSFLVKSDDKKYKRTELNDFIYSSNNLDVGSIGLNKYGTAVISVVYEIFKCKENCVPDCINALLQKPQSIAKMLKFRQGALYGQYKIPAEDFLSIEIDMPSLEEQQKIADFLSSVDEVIAASEQEVANLETQKKAVMKKIFSQEVRFKREDGSDFPEWEGKLLGEVAEIKDSARVPNNLWKKSGVPYYRAKDFNDGNLQGELFISYEDYVKYKKNTGAPELGDLMFVSGGNVGLCVLKKDDAPVYVQGGAILYVRTSVSAHLEGSYLLHYFASEQTKKYIKNTAVGGTITHFTIKPASSMPVLIPCLEEQHLIADFLSNFDEAIAAAKKELELWKELKKGLLQQMFV